MAPIPKLEPIVLEQISKIIGDSLTGSQITGLFENFGYQDCPQYTKWRRINAFFEYSQNRYNASNQVLHFIEHSCSPVSFINKNDEFQKILFELNQVLVFSSLKLCDDGKIRQTLKANTINEAKSRASEIHKILFDRNIHPDVLKFCKEEIIQDNYFHAVLEATKSLSDKIRSKTGLGDDASTLVHKAFDRERPLLALNSLQTASERNEHIGLRNLLLGIFSMFRNIAAHEAKIHWNIDKQDAIDLLTMISFAHRKLDLCFRTSYPTENQK